MHHILFQHHAENNYSSTWKYLKYTHPCRDCSTSTADQWDTSHCRAHHGLDGILFSLNYSSLLSMDGLLDYELQTNYLNLTGRNGWNSHHNQGVYFGEEEPLFQRLVDQRCCKAHPGLTQIKRLLEPWSCGQDWTKILKKEFNTVLSARVISALLHCHHSSHGNMAYQTVVKITWWCSWPIHGTYVFHYNWCSIKNGWKSIQ